MNLFMRLFVFCFLTSRALGASHLAFSSHDFSHAESFEKNDRILLKLTLTPQGQEKASELNKTGLGKKTRFVLSGKTYHWILRAPIAGPELEAGPRFSRRGRSNL